MTSFEPAGLNMSRSRKSVLSSRIFKLLSKIEQFVDNFFGPCTKEKPLDELFTMFYFYFYFFSNRQMICKRIGIKLLEIDLGAVVPYSFIRKIRLFIFTNIKQSSKKSKWPTSIFILLKKMSKDFTCSLDSSFISYVLGASKSKLLSFLSYLVLFANTMQIAQDNFETTICQFCDTFFVMHMSTGWKNAKEGN
jgi:hypothetical protein